MPLSLADVLAAMSQKPQPDNSVAQAAQLAQAPQGGDPVTQAAQLAQAPPQTLHQRALASLAQMHPQVDPTVGGTAPQANDSMPQATPDLGGGVPQFQAAPDLAAHHSWLSNAVSGIGHGIQKASASFGQRLAGIDPELAKTMTPDQIQHASQQALFQSGATALQPQWGDHSLAQIARGLQAGNQAGQQAAQGSVQANQYTAQLANTAHVQQVRQQVSASWPKPGDDDATTEGKLNALQGGVVALATAGDDKGAQALDGALKSFRDNKNGANSPFAQVNANAFHSVYDKRTGMYLQKDGKTWAPTIATEETDYHAAETDRAQTTAEVNAADRQKSAFQTQYVKPYLKPATAIASWNSIYPFAETKPEATKAAITAFVGAMEPNVQLRYATLQYLSTVDPSLAGRIKTMIQGGTYGTIPKYQLDEMNQIVRAKGASYRQQYENSRAAGAAMYPGLRDTTQPWESLTGEARAAGAVGPIGGAAPSAAPTVNPYPKRNP